MNTPGHIHAGGADCARYQRVLAALRAAGDRGLTTRELLRNSNICAHTATVSELRQLGHDIACDYRGRSAEGERVYVYRLVEAAKQADLFGGAA